MNRNSAWTRDSLTDYDEGGEVAGAVGGARKALLSGQSSTSSSLPTYDAVASAEDNNEWKWDGRRWNIETLEVAGIRHGRSNHMYK